MDIIKERLYERKQRKQRRIKEYEELTISDDFMFYKVMQNAELCKEMLEIILDIEIEKLVYTTRQKFFKRFYDGKGIRLDVYAKDEQETVYNLEMQAIKLDDLPQRSRYYQGLIDTETFKEGTDYKKLNKSIVIFICRFDLFKKGRPVYTFKNFCEEDKELELRDAATKMFVNSKWVLDKDKWEKSLVTPRMESLLRYIEKGKVTDDYTQKLDGEVSKVKQDMRWRRKYMVYQKNIHCAKLEGIEIGRNEGIEIGRNEGIEIGKNEGIKLMTELYARLIEDERFDDAKKAKEDSEYLYKLLKEYNLE